MESEVPTPRFTVSREIATFLVSCGLLRKVWDECSSASKAESFTVNEDEDVAYVTFPSFQRIEDFIVNGREGNRQTDNNVFSGCFKGNDGNPALIHPGALRLFIYVMENTDFKEKIDQLKINTESKERRVIFVGNSLGGAVAILATLWVLKQSMTQSSPFCITFGCPLVGDERLVEAIRRERWAGSFYHVVSKNDIVPRMFLAPFESTAEPLNAVLPSWWAKINNAKNDQPDFFIQDAYMTLVQSSPYKPFGFYIFCSSRGATCIAISETVSTMLRLQGQRHETSSDNVQDCLLEHQRYEDVLEDVLEDAIKNCKRPTIIMEYPSESSFDMGISLQLEALGLQNEPARTALRREGEIEHKINTNVENLAIELTRAQRSMAELEWYKESCEKDGDSGYYDTFKTQNGKNDIHANVCREKLAGFWDEIIEMWENHELPIDFQNRKKWIYAGNTYSRLVEPLDIAHYYRTNPNGNYISVGRPIRHKVLQRWMEEKKKTLRGPGTRTKQASLIDDSCFWARVEEALKDLKNLKQGQQEQSQQNLQAFEEYVKKMREVNSTSPDMYLFKSSYMVWRKEWDEYKDGSILE